MESSKINEIIDRLIPPNDFQHRKDFDNKHLVDRLSNEEKDPAEEGLINRLSSKNDLLIVETLGYMKSQKSIPLLVNILNTCSNAMERIIIASSIYEINHDSKMISSSLDDFGKLSSIYQKIPAFYYLRKFQSEDTDRLIGQHVNDSEYLISYNAKRALTM